MSILVKILEECVSKYEKYKRHAILNKLGHCGRNAIIEETKIHNPQNIYLYDDANILKGFIFINHKGRFFFHKGSSAARNLTVVTDSHIRAVGKFFKDKELWYKRNTASRYQGFSWCNYWGWLCDTWYNTSLCYCYGKSGKNYRILFYSGRNY